MPIVVAQIELQTHDAEMVLRLSNIEKFNDGSGFRCTLTVRSNGFGCDRPFFFDGSCLSDAIEGLRRMARVEPAVAVIKGRWEDDHIRFEGNDSGQVWVSGAVLENAGATQSLKFTFRTDQTVLPSLIRDLDRLLDA